MKIIKKIGTDNLAYVYVAKTSEGKYLEFVESVQPPKPLNIKWVLIISTLYGCPVGCKICDAGDFYTGKVSKSDMFRQIDKLVIERFPDKQIKTDLLKIQFARMGEPTFNNDVHEVIEELKDRYDVLAIMPCISTIAPKGCEQYLSRLAKIKTSLYSGGNFQLQFSVHSTNDDIRDSLIPIKKLKLEQIADAGVNFFNTGDRKITLNFALSPDYQIDPATLKKIFDPNIFLIKLTPINPSIKAIENKLENRLDNKHLKINPLIRKLRNFGFDVILSIGELEENQIGSNCGQYIKKFIDSEISEYDSYNYLTQKERT